MAMEDPGTARALLFGSELPGFQRSIQVTGHVENPRLLGLGIRLGHGVAECLVVFFSIFLRRYLRMTSLSWRRASRRRPRRMKIGGWTHLRRSTKRSTNRVKSRRVV